MAHTITVYIDQDSARTDGLYPKKLAVHLSAKFGRDVSVDTCLGGRNGSECHAYRRTLSNVDLAAHDELNKYVQEFEVEWLADEIREAVAMNFTGCHSAIAEVRRLLDNLESTILREELGQEPGRR